MITDLLLSSVPSLVLGTSAGIISGLLPGLGNLISMIVLFPFIAHWEPLHVFVCYAVLTMLSQFVGSLTALYTGIPGEASSMPTVIETKHLPIGQLHEAVAGTAIGSLIASVIAITLTVVLIPYLNGVSWFYRTEVLLLAIAATTVLIVMLDHQQKAATIALLIIGLMIGQIGWNNTLSIGVLTFGVAELYKGIPVDLVLLFLFAFPQLMQIRSSSAPINFSTKFTWPRIPIISTIGHSILGFIGGLVPGLTTVMSSQLSYSVSSRHTTDPYHRILASETANNAGAVSQLIPLLVIGLPLVASEALTLSIMEARGFVATPTTAELIIVAAAPLLIIASVIGLIVAWPLARQALSILRIHNKLFRQLLLLTLLILVYVQAYNDHALLFYLLVSVALLPMGWVVRNLDTTALIFGFFISDRLWDHCLRLVNLYLH